MSKACYDAGLAKVKENLGLTLCRVADFPHAKHVVARSNNIKSIEVEYRGVTAPPQDTILDVSPLKKMIYLAGESPLIVAKAD